MLRCISDPDRKVLGGVVHITISGLLTGCTGPLSTIDPAGPAAQLLGDRDAQDEYRDAVHEYASAFDVAEAEAVRRRRSDFSADDQERLARAQHLLRVAADPAATPSERNSAYSKARRELDGLIALPAVTRAAIERRVAGEIEA